MRLASVGDWWERVVNKVVEVEKKKKKKEILNPERKVCSVCRFLFFFFLGSVINLLHNGSQSTGMEGK